MWGTRCSTPGTALPLRFIPTHVGNSPPSSGTSTRRPVHPHTCGELGSPRNLRATVFGSSPHMWGTHAHPAQSVRIDRFIPTHVGNSADFMRETGLTTVHPHTCGELISRVRGHLIFFGSSPHMWGTLSTAECVAIYDRFIPTHVGNSEPPHSTLSGHWVHPHTCGELHTCLFPPEMLTGSSPHMWGTHLQWLWQHI